MSNLQTSSLIAAALGATVAFIGVAGMFIYEKIIQSRQHAMRNSKFDMVNQKISELQAEIEALRLEQSKQNKKKKSMGHRHQSTDSTHTVTGNDTDIDAFSTTGTELGDDEFYDCSDSEGGAGDNEVRTIEAMNDLDSALAAIDEHMNVDEEFKKEVYSKLQFFANYYPYNVDVIWRFAKACYDYSNYVSDSDHKKNIILEGICACDQVIELQNADLHKWYAILKGIYGEFLPTADRIKNGYCFKKHILMALQMRPEDPILHHLFGRFKYEVSSLSWIERKIATTLYSEPPNSSYEDAIGSFERAEELAVEPNLENRLFLSKAYIAVNQYQKAVYWLNKTCEPIAVTKTDMQTQATANELLSKYSGYSDYS